MLQISMMTLYHYCSHRDDPLLLFNSNVTGVFNMMTLYQLFFLSGVENVINFDCPPNSNTYIHRVGRYVWTFCVWEGKCYYYNTERLVVMNMGLP